MNPKVTISIELGGHVFPTTILLAELEAYEKPEMALLAMLQVCGRKINSPPNLHPTADIEELRLVMRRVEYLIAMGHGKN